jgi:hypothetical protein
MLIFDCSTILRFSNCAFLASCGFSSHRKRLTSIMAYSHLIDCQLQLEGIDMGVQVVFEHANIIFLTQGPLQLPERKPQLACIHRPTLQKFEFLELYQELLDTIFAIRNLFHGCLVLSCRELIGFVENLIQRAECPPELQVICFGATRIGQ